MVHWVAQVESDEVDARCGCLPLNHNTRHFQNGFTGQEHKDVSCILLGVMVDLTLPGLQSSVRLARLVQAILDFIYLSQYPVHTTESLRDMDTALTQFHENKDVLIELGVRQYFNIPKLHSLLHYTRSIRHFGTADNYNTEQSEHLHIDYAKKAFRATNFKNEYKQMTIYLERLEAIHQHAAFIDWCKGSRHSVLPTTPLAYPCQNWMLCAVLTRYPSEARINFEGLFNRHGAIDFQDVLADFIVQHNYPGLLAAVAQRCANNTLLSFRRVSVFHKVKFIDPEDINAGIVNAVHI